MQGFKRIIISLLSVFIYMVTVVVQWCCCDAGVGVVDGGGGSYDSVMVTIFLYSKSYC